MVGGRCLSLFFSLWMQQYHLLKTLAFPHWIELTFVKHQMIVKMQVCFCAPYPSLLIDLSVLMPVTLC